MSEPLSLGRFVAIRLADSIHVMYAKLSAVRTVQQSKGVGSVEKLERLINPHDSYSDAARTCQRQFNRQNLTSEFKRTALLPAQLLSAVLAYPRRFRTRAELQLRINAIEPPLRPPEAPWRIAAQTDSRIELAHPTD